MKNVQPLPLRTSGHHAFLPADGMSDAFEAVLRSRCAEGSHGLVVDLRALEQRYANAATAAAANDVQLLYAVKACTDPEVLGRAERFGLGFDVANRHELGCARTTSPLAPVSLTAPAIPMEERELLYAAFARGEIQRWHCDSLAQLDELARACPGATVGVRVNMDGLPMPEEMPIYRPSRFGIRLDQLPAARDIAASHGCRLRWLHAHNGSEENDTASYVFAAEHIVAAARASEIELESLDLGGGLLGEPTVAGLSAFFEAVRAAVGPDVQLTFEPGRFWLTDCISLVTRVLDVKEGSDCVWLLLDLGVHSHLTWSFSMRIPALGRLVPDDPRPWRICGRSCYEEDVLDDDEVVPTEADAPVPSVGDWLVLGNVTGYSIELGSDFNGVTRPAVDFVRP